MVHECAGAGPAAACLASEEPPRGRTSDIHNLRHALIHATNTPHDFTSHISPSDVILEATVGASSAFISHPIPERVRC